MGRFEIGAAVLAVAHAGAGPAIAEDAVDLVERHDLAGHCGHELEIVRSERARDPAAGRGPVAPLVAVLVDSDPIRMGIVNILEAGAAMRARHANHAELAPSPPHMTQGV